MSSKTYQTFNRTLRYSNLNRRIQNSCNEFGCNSKRCKSVCKRDSDWSRYHLFLSLYCSFHSPWTYPNKGTFAYLTLYLVFLWKNDSESLFNLRNHKGSASSDARFIGAISLSLFYPLEEWDRFSSRIRYGIQSRWARLKAFQRSRIDLERSSPFKLRTTTDRKITTLRHTAGPVIVFIFQPDSNTSTTRLGRRCVCTDSIWHHPPQLVKRVKVYISPLFEQPRILLHVVNLTREFDKVL